MSQSKWEQISAKARQKVLDDIPAEWKIPQEKLPGDDIRDVTGVAASSGILSERELAITDSLATEIVAKVGTGEWKAEEVTVAFCKRAALAHQVVRYCCNKIHRRLFFFLSPPPPPIPPYSMWENFLIFSYLFLVLL